MPSQMTKSGARMTRGIALSRIITGSIRSANSGISAAAKPRTMPTASPTTRPMMAAENVASRCGQISPSANNENSTFATAEGDGT